ncbi:hypothetical protein [Demequina salsinemoris]|uniref:hypothetical protein n=1 Tax=Demequina salsinemoris TaxID=577470 RepID=UPI0007863AED|nr:hypothetical protein [Demequina salsinemoris]
MVGIIVTVMSVLTTVVAFSIAYGDRDEFTRFRTGVVYGSLALSVVWGWLFARTDLLGSMLVKWAVFVIAPGLLAYVLGRMLWRRRERGRTTPTR